MNDDELAFRRAILENPDCDTTRLVYADWLEENGRDATRWRQWTAIRRECRKQVNWDKKEYYNPTNICGNLKRVPAWLHRCYAVDMYHVITSRFPIWPGHEKWYYAGIMWLEILNSSALCVELLACEIIDILGKECHEVRDMLRSLCNRIRTQTIDGARDHERRMTVAGSLLSSSLAQSIDLISITHAVDGMVMCCGDICPTHVKRGVASEYAYYIDHEWYCLCEYGPRDTASF